MTPKCTLLSVLLFPNYRKIFLPYSFKGKIFMLFITENAVTQKGKV